MRTQDSEVDAIVVLVSRNSSALAPQDLDTKITKELLLASDRKLHGRMAPPSTSSLSARGLQWAVTRQCLPNLS